MGQGEAAGDKQGVYRINRSPPPPPPALNLSKTHSGFVLFLWLMDLGTLHLPTSQTQKAGLAAGGWISIFIPDFAVCRPQGSAVHILCITLEGLEQRCSIPALLEGCSPEKAMHKTSSPGFVSWDINLPKKDRQQSWISLFEDLVCQSKYLAIHKNAFQMLFFPGQMLHNTTTCLKYLPPKCYVLIANSIKTTKKSSNKFVPKKFYGFFAKAWKKIKPFLK